MEEGIENTSLQDSK